MSQHQKFPSTAVISRLRTLGRLHGAGLPGATLLAATLLGGCGGGGVTKLLGIPSPAASYTVGGSVSGLAGSGLVVSDGIDSLTISANGSFQFPSTIPSGGSYFVTVDTAPANPTQTCTVTNGSGSIGSANITTVAVACVTNTYHIAVNVTGLAGSGLILEDNGGDDLTVPTNGTYTFATAVASGAAYAVTVKTAPVNPSQTCSAANGSGTVGAADVANVTLTCTTPAGAPVPQVTPKGSPSGSATTQNIDAAGGSVLSADGRIALSIPANALSVATQISIQPITNQAPGGQGLAYRLTPEGQTFAVPITLTFNYTGQDTEGSAPQSLAIAFQDPQAGYWRVYKASTLDTTAQSISVTTTHFSDWAVLLGDQITPYAASVATNHSVAFAISECDVIVPPLTDPNFTLAMQCGPPLGAAIGSAVKFQNWSVNGIVGGNAALGTIVPAADGTSAVYTAPSATPSPNPVSITVSDTAPLTGGTKEILFANATVDSCGTPSNVCSWSGTTSFTGPVLTGTAYAEWGFSSSASQNGAVGADFTPIAGSVKLRAAQPHCTVSPATITLPSGPPASIINILYSATLTTYALNGITADVTLTCTDPISGTVTTSTVTPAYLNSATPGVYPPVSADGKTIAGSNSNGSESWTWSLTGK